MQASGLHSKGQARGLHHMTRGLSASALHQSRNRHWQQAASGTQVSGADDSSVGFELHYAMEHVASRFGMDYNRIQVDL
jgi:hypothetical protein